MAIKVTAAYDLGNDLVLVKGTIDGVSAPDGSLATITGYGWLSAMSHYYPPAAYDGEGNLAAGATPRSMTASERLAYCKAVLATASPPGLPASGRNLGISG